MKANIWRGILVGSLWAGALQGAGSAVPVDTPFKVHGRLESTDLGNVLMQGDDYIITRNASANDADFNNIYWVNSSKPVAAEAMKGFGNLLYQGQDFSLVNLSAGEAEDLSGIMHEAGMACGSLFKLDGDVIVEKPRFMAPRPIVSVSRVDRKVKAVVSKVNDKLIRSKVEDLSGMYSRHHTTNAGQDVAAGLADDYRRLSAGRSDVTVSTYAHRNTDQDSLVVRIEGTRFPDEVIVIGSHIDSIAGWGGSSKAPGADDNASGTATNLEIFRVLMEQGIRPLRTVEIHGYGAEEIGLVGSQEIARDYRERDVNVIAMLQHDMNLFRYKEDAITFVTNGTDTALTNALKTVAGNYLDIRVKSGRLTAGTSDHRSWQRQGYPVAFPTEDTQNYNRNIHTARDTISNSGAFSQATGFAKFGVAFVGHYGGF